MQRVQFVPNSFGVTGPRRWAAIGFAGFINAALIYALASGLAIRFVEQLPGAIQVDVVKPSHVARSILPPPPAPEMAVPSMPQIPIPKVVIAHPQPVPHAITAVVVEKPAVAPPVSMTPAKAAAIIAPTPARGVARTHTTPPYPPLAIRLSQQGTVRLHIALGSSGAIRRVDVLKSSGNQTLDEAAVAWVSKHWRYEPATRGGKPVASSVLADVKFDLRDAR